MTDYYWGLLIGAIIGYCGALFTMIMMWALWRRHMMIEVNKNE
jgi:hypothetical protein